MSMTITFPAKGAGKLFEGDGLKLKPVMIDFGAYATNGIAITADACDMQQIDAIFFETCDLTNIKSCHYDKSAGKILAYSDFFTTEVANTTDCSGQRVAALVLGR